MPRSLASPPLSTTAATRSRFEIRNAGSTQLTIHNTDAGTEMSDVAVKARLDTLAGER